MSVQGQRKQRVIQRDRLLSLMDTHEGRVRLLLAQAGYGKTTLARQWLRLRDRRAVWIRLVPSAGDVTVLARLIADECEPVVPGIAATTSSRLRGTRSPENEAAALGSFLSEQLANWPEDTWLVFDDAHFIASANSSSAFMEALLKAPNLQIILLSRRRPSWLPIRRAIYGELDEICQTDLAFDECEAAALGVSIASKDGRALMTVSRGWPAVVALAVRNSVVPIPSELPAQLFDYFAEEIYRGCDASLRSHLLQLAILPDLDASLVADILGTDAVDALAIGVEEGLVTFDRSAGYEIHPLLRAFLQTKLQQIPDARKTASLVAQALYDQSRWDEAFEVIQSFALVELLSTLFAVQQSLLSAGRLATLETWISFANTSAASFPLLDLAEAEVARRRGRRAAGHALALQAARTLGDSDPFAAQAFSIAGECVFLDQPELSLEYQRRAERLAQTHDDRVRAIWGQITLATDLREGGYSEALVRFRRIRNGDPNLELRIAASIAVIAHIDGGIQTAAAEVERFEPVVQRATDPLARTHFLYRLSYLNILAARYAKAASLATEGIEEAARMRIEFVRPHLLAARAASQLGLRQLKRAELTLAAAGIAAEALDDDFELLNVLALKARVALARGRVGAARSLLPLAAIKTQSPALRGECLALRAVILAVADAPGEALELAALATKETKEVQSQNYSVLARAIVAEKNRCWDRRAAYEELESILQITEALDPLVVAYRAYPQILTSMLHFGTAVDIAQMLTRTNDTVIANRLGITVSTAPEAKDRLTPREQEVFELICEGLTNKEIAARLYITESTAKLHVRHILGKLGVRSRTEAVLSIGNDQLERPR